MYDFPVYINLCDSRYVLVCVRERVCVAEREREREREILYISIYVRERARALVCESGVCVAYVCMDVY